MISIQNIFRTVRSTDKLLRTNMGLLLFTYVARTHQVFKDSFGTVPYCLYRTSTGTGTPNIVFRKENRFVDHKLARPEMMRAR